jgi:hypothetical protein
MYAMKKRARQLLHSIVDEPAPEKKSAAANSAKDGCPAHLS